MKADYSMGLAQHLVKDAILCDLEVVDKEDAIRQLVDALVAAKAIPKTKASAAAEEIISRERSATTGIGSGVGVPHARSEQVKSLILAIGRVPGGLEFGAVDGDKVKVIVLLLSPKADRELHLGAMKAIVSIVRDPYQCKRLLGCSTSASFIDLLDEIAS